MVAPIIATLLLVAIAVVGGSIIFVFSQGFFASAGVYSDAFTLVISQYREVVDECDLGDDDDRIKDELFSAKKLHLLNNDTQRAQSILDEIKPTLDDCPRKNPIEIMGINEKNFLTFAILVGGLVISTLGFVREKTSKKLK